MLRNLTCGKFELKSSSLLLRRQESKQLRRMLSRFIQEEVGFLPCNRLSSIREQGSATKPRARRNCSSSDSGSSSDSDYKKRKGKSGPKKINRGKRSTVLLVEIWAMWRQSVLRSKNRHTRALKFQAFRESVCCAGRQRIWRRSVL